MSRHSKLEDFLGNTHAICINNMAVTQQHPMRLQAWNQRTVGAEGPLFFPFKALREPRLSHTRLQVCSPALVQAALLHSRLTTGGSFISYEGYPLFGDINLQWVFFFPMQIKNVYKSLMKA